MSPAWKMEEAWILIPAYNESEVIESTVKGAKEHFSNVLVVDDCSADDTYEIAKHAGATVIKHPINLGQGAALETGLTFIRGHGGKTAITFDADGQHRTEDAVRMMEELAKTNHDVILGSRFLGQISNIPRTRRWLLNWATRFTRFTTGLQLTDTHNGLRAFGPNALNKIRITQNQMAHASEILSLIAQHKLSYTEIPITIRYTEYSLRKGQRISGALHILFDLFIERLVKR